MAARPKITVGGTAGTIVLIRTSTRTHEVPQPSPGEAVRFVLRFQRST